MSLFSNAMAVTACAARTRRAGLAAGLTAAALLGACATPVTSVTRVYGAPGQAESAAYAEFGTVRRIDVEETRQPVTGGGAALGALIGGVVGNDIGRGFGRAATTAIGAVGGALVGNEVEHNAADAHSGTRYRVVVRLDDGRIRRIDLAAPGGLYVGERVRVEGGMLGPA